MRIASLGLLVTVLFAPQQPRTPAIQDDGAPALLRGRIVDRVTIASHGSGLRQSPNGSRCSTTIDASSIWPYGLFVGNGRNSRGWQLAIGSWGLGVDTRLVALSLFLALTTPQDPPPPPRRRRCARSAIRRFDVRGARHDRRYWPIPPHGPPTGRVLHRGQAARHLDVRRKGTADALFCADLFSRNRRCLRSPSREDCQRSGGRRDRLQSRARPRCRAFRDGGCFRSSWGQAAGR